MPPLILLTATRRHWRASFAYAVLSTTRTFGGRRWPPSETVLSLTQLTHTSGSFGGSH